MATIAGRQYSSPKNINLKQGILRFDVSKSSNPLSNDSKGWGLYVDSSNQLCYWNKTGITVLGSGGGGSTPTWETLFGADATFTITPDTTFTIAGNRATATDVLTLTNVAGGSGDVLQITNSGTGNDISGTSGLFAVTKAGVISARGLTFGAASTITSTAGDITWTLEDNDATALKIGSSGATSIINIITTDGSEAVVFGNGMTLTDGKFTATSTSNTVPLFLLRNDTITTFGSDSAEDSGAFVFSSDSLTTGDLIRLQLDESALNGGYFLKAVQTDGGTAVFTIGEAGATVIAGVASGTTALTLTAGDLVITSGTATLTAGGLTLTLGDLTLTSGNIVQTLGDLTLTAGNFTMTVGDAVLTDGSLTITDADNASTLDITNNTITTADLVVIDSTSITTGALMKLNSNAATADGEVLEIISAGDATSTPIGLSVTIASVTTGAAKGAVITMAGATTTAIGLTVDMAALTTGTGALITSAGTIITTGELLSLVGNSATTCTGLLRVSGTGLTDGFAMEITGGGANATASGGVVNIAAGAAIAGTALKVLTSGVYTGTTGVLSVSAASATTGIIANIVGTGLTTGTGLLISATEATIQTTGFYIRCYDGAANDFSVSKYGATVIAGSASGTAALTLTAGDLVVTSGTLTLTLGSATLTAGNLILTAGTVITTSQAIVNANTAISVTHGVTTIANNAGSTHTLADGVIGQKKTILCTVYTGDAVITPDSLANGTTITLNAVGDGCDLVFTGTEWWVTNLYGTAALA
jgi:hypothetical protein